MTQLPSPETVVGDFNNVHFGQETAVIPPFDYLASEAERTAVLQQWQTWWYNLDKQAIPHPGPAVPLDDNLQPLEGVIRPLIAAQSQKIIQIGE